MSSLAPSRFQRAFRKAVRPLRRTIAGSPTPARLEEFGNSVLVLIAHPDDEVFCSGLICRLRAGGTAVHLVAFTRGEGGERGDLADGVGLASAREGELAVAAEILGVSSLSFLDYPDPPSQGGTLAAPEHDSAELLAEIQATIDQREISDLVSHGSGGEYWHPAHLCLHRHARALTRRNSALQLWTFSAWSRSHPLQGILNQDDPAHLSLDSTEYHEQRVRSLAAHRSQRAIFERFCNSTLDDFIKLTAIENFRKW